MSLEFRPLNRRTLGQQVFDELLELLQSGQLKPGDALPSQHELARSLSVSRPVLREAMQRLAAAGLVEIRHGSGCYVAQPSHNGSLDVLLASFTREAALEVIETRMIIETEMAALAATRASDRDLRRMEKALASIHRLREQGGLTVPGDVEFHQALAAASHNRVLGALWKQLHQPTYVESVRVQLAMPDVLEDSYDNHRILYDAVRSRDPERARATAREHLERAHGWAQQIDELRRQIRATSTETSGAGGQPIAR